MIYVLNCFYHPIEIELEQRKSEERQITRLCFAASNSFYLGPDFDPDLDLDIDIDLDLDPYLDLDLDNDPDLGPDFDNDPDLGHFVF